MSSVNDQRVYQIIKETLRNSMGSSIHEHLSSAWEIINYEREENHPGDVDYAAAEHYLYSRWIVSWTGVIGWVIIAISAGGYDLAKKYLPESVRSKLKSGEGPVTPYAKGDVQWSHRGANDGKIDFNASIKGERTVPQDPDDPW